MIPDKAREKKLLEAVSGEKLSRIPKFFLTHKAGKEPGTWRFLSATLNRSRYMPHQGAQEIARRKRQRQVKEFGMAPKLIQLQETPRIVVL